MNTFDTQNFSQMRRLASSDTNLGQIELLKLQHAVAHTIAFVRTRLNVSAPNRNQHSVRSTSLIRLLVVESRPGNVKPSALLPEQILSSFRRETQFAATSHQIQPSDHPRQDDQTVHLLDSVLTSVPSNGNVLPAQDRTIRLTTGVNLFSFVFSKSSAETGRTASLADDFSGIVCGRLSRMI